MPICININADMAEGFGAYDIGDDASILDIVRSANIACGMHGGDPGTMRRVAEAAAARAVSIGAHPGFNDLWGFGRRRIDMDPRDLEYLVAYQIGAMQAMAAHAGTRVTHVKAHGALNNMGCVRADYADAIAALNNMGCVRADYADAIARAIKAVDATLINLAMPGTEMERATREQGLALGREAFVDRTYEDDGTLTPRSVPGSVIKDPELAARRVVEMVTTGTITARSGKALPLSFDSLCVHGDEPTAVAVARAARAALEAAGVEIVTLPEMLDR